MTQDTTQLATPLQQYDRQAHLNWYEQKYPNRPEWPPYPRTNLEASDAILAYTGRQAEQDAEDPVTDGAAPGLRNADVATALAEVLAGGYQVEISGDRDGVTVDITEAGAAAMHTGIGSSVAAALEAAMFGMNGGGQ